MTYHLKSGATADLLTVDPTSKAMRVEHYDSAALPLNPIPVGVYMLPVNVRIGGAANGFGLWALQVPASAARDVYIRRIFLRSAFDGTAASSAPHGVGVHRVNGVTITSGTVLTPIKLDSTYAASVIVTTAQQSDGTTKLSLSGGTTLAALAYLQMDSQTGFNGALDLNWFEADNPYSMLKLVDDEGLLLYVDFASIVAGVSVSGFVVWEER